tara:strand:- start:59 stop:217 length:159 start_codon:yes stop_codon:yes gene_type:complete
MRLGLSQSFVDIICGVICGILVGCNANNIVFLVHFKLDLAGATDLVEGRVLL